MPQSPRIAVDMTMLKYPYTGLGQFSLYLGRELLQNNLERYGYDFLLYPSKQEFFQPLAYTPNVMQVGKRLLAKNHLPYTFRRYDLWHILSQNSHYFPFQSKSPIIYTIHDLNFLKEDSPKKIGIRLKKIQKQIKYTTQLTAISRYVADDMSANLDLGGKTIEVIYNGVEIAHFPHTTRPHFLPEGLPFIFTVGSITPRKNFHALIEMMRFLPHLRLVIAGKKDDTAYTEKMQNIITTHHLQDRVLLAGMIQDEEKYWLYKNCEAFAFPSLLEGFGMPIIEAFSVGKPVFASSLTSLPEVGGTLTRYWYDFDPENMANIFKKGIEEIKQDTLFKEKAYAQAKLFTWEQAGKKYRDLYHRILKNVKQK